METVTAQIEPVGGGTVKTEVVDGNKPWQPPLVAAPEPPAAKPVRRTPFTLMEEAVAFLLHDHVKHAVDPAKQARASLLLLNLEAEPNARETEDERESGYVPDGPAKPAGEVQSEVIADIAPLT